MKNNIQKLYYILGEGFAKGTVFLVFYIFANYLSKENFGKLSLFWAAVPMVSIFIDLAQRSYVKIFYLNNKEKIHTLLKNLYVFLFSFYILLLLIQQGFSSLGHFFIDKDFDLYLVTSSFFFVIIELYLSYLQIKGKIFQYSIIYIIRSSATYILTAFIFVVYVVRLDVYPKIYIAVLGGVVIYILNIVLKKGDKINKVSIKEYVIKSLKFSTPLIFGTLSAIGLNVADRYMINYYYSETEVANYTVAYTVASILMAFFMATNKWWQKFTLDALAEQNLDKIRKKIPFYFGLVIMVGLIVLLFRKLLVKYLSSESYFIILDIIPVLILGMFFYFLYTILINVPFFYKNTKIQVLPSIISFIMNLLLNFLLIPKYGYKIAAFTTCISYFMEFLLMYLICIYKFKIEFIFSSFNLIKIKKDKWKI